MQSLEEYYEFIEIWKGKVRYSDLEIVDYFEVYPLIDAPRAYLPLISSEKYFTVDNVVFEFYDDNYIVSPSSSDYDVSRLINLKSKSEDFENEVFAYPYKSGISTRTNEPCEEIDDNGGLFCYARRLRGIHNYELSDAVKIRGGWLHVFSQIVETRAARRASGIWWSTNANEVNMDYNFNAVINASGSSYSNLVEVITT